MSISKPHLASQCYSRWYSWDCRSYQRSINLNGEADCNDSAKHCGNKVKVNKVWINKKDMGVQACIMPTQFFWLSLADFSCPTFAVKYFCQCFKKQNKTKKLVFVHLWTIVSFLV